MNFCQREPAGGVEIFEAVRLARQSGQALVEIFEKLAKENAQKKIPKKKKGREETRNTGDWEFW